MILLEEAKELLGTRVQIFMAVYDEGRARSAMERAFAECERIENKYSRFIEGNALAKLNARVGEWVRVDEEFYELIAFGARAGKRTVGAFDLSVKTVLEGWGYDADYSLKEHGAGELGEVLLGEDGELGKGYVKLTAPIELGGLGKGYALDRMMAYLEGFANVCLDGGGDILARGLNAEGRPWRAALEHPLDLSKGIGYVDIPEAGLALGSSSPSRRKWRDRHHLVDPDALAPASQMLSVYTQAPAALLADTYSTALFVMGFEEAQKRLPELPVEALLVGPEQQVFKSEGFLGEVF